jgi:hypothetical protein
MKKSIKDFRERALSNLHTIKGGEGPVGRDKIKIPPPGR